MILVSVLTGELVVAPTASAGEADRGRAPLWTDAAAQRFERITRVAARLFGVSVAALSLVDEGGARIRSAVGLGAELRDPACGAIAAAVVAAGERVVVADAAADERLASDPLFGAVGLRWCVGAPLRAPGGRCVGVLWIADRGGAPPGDAALGALDDLGALAEEGLAAALRGGGESPSSSAKARALDAARELRAPTDALLRSARGLVSGARGTEEVGERVAQLESVGAELLAALEDFVALERGGGGRGEGREAPAKGGAGARPRVLVVEDYLPSQHLLRAQLEHLGCAVEAVPSAAEALESFAAGPWDLVLTDVQLPKTDGLALARQLRATPTGADLPIVALSADVDVDDREALAAGIAEVCMKPLAIDGLQRILARWVRRAGDEARTEVGDDVTPVVDLEALERFVGELGVDVGGLLDEFLEAAREQLERLTRTTDAAVIAREAHRQKPTARAFGALRYVELLEAVERAAEAGGGGRLEVLFRALGRGLDDFEASVKRAPFVESATGIAAPRPLASPSSPCASALGVDDEPIVRNLLVSMLEALGVERIESATNGDQAIEAIRRSERPFDVVFCDLEMPGRDGIQAIRRLGELGFVGGLVVMSGRPGVLDSVSRLAELYGLRLLGQVQKPLHPEVVAELLQSLALPVRRREALPVLDEPGADEVYAGIAAGEFAVVFQPKVNARNLRPVGVEALARWRRADGRVVPPSTFIALAERDAELCAALSKHLAELAIRDGATLVAVAPRLQVSFNLSATWLDDLELPEFLVATAAAAGLAPASLNVEVTETAVLRDLALALDVLARLRLKGFGLSIDDFGIGYSSFEQLRRFPFTELKLDRTFVAEACADRSARAVIESSILLARKLGLATVAEGVETRDDLELLRGLGCDELQGYHIARPMPTAEAIRWLRQRSPTTRPPATSET
jgi:EAL domain-containing protein (putative c-di-GMP-specific phosphodiesterase class I)/DNA-binding response OmpR family regulator